VSLEEIARSLGLDLAAVQRLAETFLSTSEQDLLELERAVAGGDAEAVARLAHHIKGAASALEAEGVHGEAAILERQGKTRRLEGADAHVSRLRSQLAAFGSELHAR
jgi:HPt (histidine-containing phosphotransfer) domain-containing protein